MNTFRLSASDFEGYGVYEHAPPGYHSLGQLPDLSVLQQYESVGGLAHVPNAAKLAAKQALEMMVFNKSQAPELGGVSGSASFVLGQTGGPWVTELVQQGNVVMVQRDSITSGAPQIIATTVPASIVMLAGTQIAEPGYVIVDGHPEAIRRAEALVEQPLPDLPSDIDPTAMLPGQPCPDGTVGPGWPQCSASGDQPLPAPTPPQQPPAEPAAAGMPDWVVPVAVGTVAALTIGALLLRGRKTTMTTNRYRAWG